VNLARLFVVAFVAIALNTTPMPRAHAQAPELPALGEVAADDLSPANERRLGESIMRQALRDPTYLPDPDATEYLNAIGYRLVAASPARYTDFGFFLVRDAMINAFALPGGFIGVHTGLILAAQSESELAAVMAHEIGHVEQRHIARMLAKQKDGTAIAIGALLLALLAARSNSSSSSDLTQAAILGGQAAAVQQQLNFSREAEREADRVGFQILVDAGFDARAMVTFFGRMQQGSRIYESGTAPSYLRTHPLTVERISDIQTRVRETRTRQRADSLDFNLVRARLRVLQDPAATVSTRYPLSPLAAHHYVDLLHKTNQHETAIDFLRDQHAIARSQPVYHGLLGRAYGALNRRTLHHQSVAEMYALMGARQPAIQQLELARRAGDGDFYTMSEIDARLRELQVEDQARHRCAARSVGRPSDRR
jgi:predicted Zn-dependent protease